MPAITVRASSTTSTSATMSMSLDSALGATHPSVNGAPAFRIGPRIGSGSFGCVYRGTWVSGTSLAATAVGMDRDIARRAPVAIKAEAVYDEKGTAKAPLIPGEAKVLLAMQGTSGFPLVHWYGECVVDQDPAAPTRLPVTTTRKRSAAATAAAVAAAAAAAAAKPRLFRMLVMDILGPSLQDLFDKCGKRLSIKTVCMIADQMLVRLEEMHTRGYLHRDLKPENILIGPPGSHQQHIIYLIDFGLACPRPGGSEPLKKHNEKCIGTLRYMCRASHRGKVQYPRDDLEALGYILVFFARGHLPWQRKYMRPVANASLSDQKKLVLDVKEYTTPEKLCEGLPHEFAQYMALARKLPYNADPPYRQLRQLFLQAAGAQYDWRYDWDAVVSAMAPPAAPVRPPSQSPVLRYSAYPPQASAAATVTAATYHHHLPPMPIHHHHYGHPYAMSGGGGRGVIGTTSVAAAGAGAARAGPGSAFHYAGGPLAMADPGGAAVAVDMLPPPAPSPFDPSAALASTYFYNRGGGGGGGHHHHPSPQHLQYTTAGGGGADGAGGGAAGGGGLQAQLALYGPAAGMQ
ncbi:kinase-like domain-containing protein [Blastocladiella britannica]|nr:kinase-like domain-containing protein [Blastocladiella britannica]